MRQYMPFWIPGRRMAAEARAKERRRPTRLDDHRLYRRSEHRPARGRRAA